MVITADDRTQNLIIARLCRSGQSKFLRALLKLKIPARNFGMVFLPQQREAMDAAIAVPGFAFACSDSQRYLFARFYSDLRLALAGDLEVAVFIRQHLNHV